MSQSGATVAQECIIAFNELKLNKKHKYIIFALSDDLQIVIDTDPKANDSDADVKSVSSDTNWDNFKDRLMASQTKGRGGKFGPGPRYAVYDFEYELASGEGTRNKIAFIAWSPDSAAPPAKMSYASSKEAIKRALSGFAVEIQANDGEDLEWSGVLEKVSKGAGRA